MGFDYRPRPALCPVHAHHQAAWRYRFDKQWAFSPKHVKSDGSRYPTDIVYFKTAESEGAVYHPTQKPVELGRYLIRTYTNPGNIVLDNACGSGSFCVAAVLEGRSFIGIEKNEDVALFKKRPVDYIDICNQRIKEAKRTFEAEQQVIS